MAGAPERPESTQRPLAETTLTSPTILHVDMNAFFVACELLRRPELVGRPVVVGGTGSRGVVAAASYEARVFGVYSAMPSVRARRLCPHAVMLPGDHAYYESVSLRVFDVFHAFTPLVEPLSVDEAFLDVTGSQRLFGDGLVIGRSIRNRIYDEIGLSCSVGVSATKFVAKLASEAAKPKVTQRGVTEGAGVLVIGPGRELSFLHPLPVRALWGVGPKTFERLARVGVATIGDLAALTLPALVAALGRSHGQHLHDLAHGRDERSVEPDRDTKSIGHEQTFSTDHHEVATLDRELMRMAEAVASRLRAARLGGRTIQIKVRFSDFATITRSVSMTEPVSSGPALLARARELLHAIDVSQGVRLLGVSVSNLGEPASQLTLDLDVFGSDGDDDMVGWDDTSRTIDEIRNKFGDTAIGPASLLDPSGLRLTRRGQQQWGPNRPSSESNDG